MENPEHQRERAANFDKFHRMCWVFIGLLATILQTMYQPFETHYREGENLDAVEEIRRVNTLRNDNANEQQVNGMLVEFLNTVEEIRRRVMDTSRNGNANEQEVNGMQDELLEAVEEIRSAMNALRNGNANEQQVNGMHDELLKAVEEIRRAMRMAMQMSNEYGMQDENQHQHHELPV
ncbi:hypothetical protein CsSME_00038899 [Camellia sinensis var. sinensis]